MFDQYLNLFDYPLSRDRIAQVPAEPRDSSRLLHLNRETGKIKHFIFSDLVKLLKENDVLVFNQTKVIPARLIGKKSTGGYAELLLIKQQQSAQWKCIGRSRLKKSQKLLFNQDLQAEVLDVDNGGGILVEFNQKDQQFLQTLDKLGNTPIPPYIANSLPEKELREKYQTVYAKYRGSAAAPTAGLHFTKKLLEELKNKNISQQFVTLHVGLGTFQNLRPTQLKTGKLHAEFCQISQQTADFLNKAKAQGKKIIAVGTTTTRVLESMTENGVLQAGAMQTRLFIKPEYRFKFVDKMITNFHLPKSSLLMLVSAFASYPQVNFKFNNFIDNPIGRAYLEAIEQKYRFFSFGDAMLIV